MTRLLGLFAQLPLNVNEETLSNLEHQLEDSEIDFDYFAKKRLKKVIRK